MDVNHGHEDPERDGVPLPDAGAMVDEHGRPPGVPSRTGTGAGPAADPARVDAARLPEAPPQGPSGEAEVNVLVSHCDREGAEAVLGVLAEAFPGMTPPAPVPAGAAVSPVAAPNIWAVTVDVRSRVPGAGLRARPASAVRAELDGAAEPVRQVRAVLEDAFSGEHLGTVSGEHELQVALRLTARGDAPEPA
ncbi:hypothetical protein BX286_1051 [Streptomyces sp. 3211.6]|uniref:hypothetical protein n=1 Tax=Streptomyces sp. 3211.6 TaxID=1938845 RepID=UPI000EADF42D|nr:hypothetical protein [Streptomyces sp. 3211.6]RKT03129.1 hypothetical protein BX286_1051 [Streptomyces sp. 3211.6]